MRRVLFVIGLTLLAGCAFKSRAIPNAPIPFADANYTVLGQTSADACGTYILGIDFGHLFTDQTGGTSGGASDPLSAILGALSGPDREEARATYDALEKMPEATNLYAPRYEETLNGIAPFHFPLFAKRCATVTAHGVKLGSGPVPNAM